MRRGKKTMNDATKAYLSAVGKNLTCGEATKARLLAELGEELSDFVRTFPPHSYEGLCGEFDPPDVTAARLNDGLAAAEKAAYGRKRGYFIMAFAAVPVVVCLLFAFLYYESIKIKPDEYGTVTITVYENGDRITEPEGVSEDESKDATSPESPNSEIIRVHPITGELKPSRET
jgi:hypothetical protein